MARKGMWLNHNYKIATPGKNMFILLYIWQIHPHVIWHLQITQLYILKLKTYINKTPQLK